MTTIFLQGAEFFAYHGFYPEEQLIGGKYLVDVVVKLQLFSGQQSDDLNDTINYESLYNICCIEMKIPRKLLETVADAIAEKIKERYPEVAELEVTVKKMHPPLQGPVNYSAVSVRYKRP